MAVALNLHYVVNPGASSMGPIYLACRASHYTPVFSVKNEHMKPRLIKVHPGRGQPT
jgi:hypothetical protein